MSEKPSLHEEIVKVLTAASQAPEKIEGLADKLLDVVDHYAEEGRAFGFEQGYNAGWTASNDATLSSLRRFLDQGPRHEPRLNG
jgi:flagellar biosynthesis/type III secretory pathway protein FliH